MPRTNRPISVTLGELQHGVETRVKSGAYASASEVMRAALRALDREEEPSTNGCASGSTRRSRTPARTCRLKRCSSASGLIIPGA